MPDVTKTPTAVEDAVALPADVTPVKQEKARSLWGDAWVDLRRNPYFIVASVLIFFLLLIAAFPSLFTSASPTRGDLVKHFLGKPELGSIGSEGWLGYDGQGRSVYARLIYGTRASIIVGVCVTAIVTLVGGVMGMLAGYFGGWVDAVLSRLTDIFFGIPFLLGAMVVLQSFVDRTVWVVVFALAFLGWTQMARVMRGAVITVKHADYVHAAKALGAGTTRILFRHILPNAMAPVIVVATIALGGYISAEATLSYLGLGLAAPTVSWGVDISTGVDQIRVAQHILLWPSIMLSITVLAFIMLGEAVRNALDPKLR
ncbi:MULTISPECIES: ABC transporter permease [Streptomyces]|uniref:Dipeptide transport system permease protein DppC n=1 Tax=Streptomyces venezuelae (strain ATCC 10712 / CBS 650.69 / DSM 40230 / JCM 4526 / NBRC 13096 / PD 04745) TaxID=953739 RepID=F2R1F6_STRVP|nr:ABC transporter permease [Streptomyces venezuelae]APE23702.1 peptide ABC transporter permease [Streptomyces venezuelae]QES01073.1 ABC transporter permease [Streptomyces venezuelae ATCC 10712]QES08169.1 ABC transporter permease [Streptomyces venezuelae]CCA58047.1 Dipeptide transport system permease protein DppC [Streptomyces venezuelae ATCC 10712]